MVQFLLGFFTCLLINSFIKARQRSKAINMLQEILDEIDPDTLKDGDTIYIKKDSQD